MAAALDELKTTGFGLRYTFLLAEYADLLGKAGRANDGLTVIDEALSRCERGQEGWCLPNEVLCTLSSSENPECRRDLSFPLQGEKTPCD
jgi:hypothetical protein